MIESKPVGENLRHLTQLGSFTLRSLPGVSGGGRLVTFANGGFIIVGVSGVAA